MFSSLLKDVDGRVGYNADDPERADAHVQRKFTFAGKPKKNVDVAFEHKTELKEVDGVDKETKASTFTSSEVEKTNIKFKLNHGDCQSSYTFANDKTAFDAIGKVVDDADWKITLFGAGEVKQDKSEWKGTAKLAVNGKDLGGAKMGMNLDVEYNQKSEITVKPKINFEIDGQYNVGLALKTDTKTVSETLAQIVYKPADSKDSFYWFRADLTRGLAMVGCDQQLKDGINHSFEGVFGWKDFKGIQGQPVAIRSGVEYELSDDTSIGASGSYGEDYSYSAELSHKFNKNWTASLWQSFDSGNVGSKKPSYHIGYGFAYKL